MRRSARVVQTAVAFGARPAEVVKSSVLDAATFPGLRNSAPIIARFRCNSGRTSVSKHPDATATADTLPVVSYTTARSGAREAGVAPEPRIRRLVPSSSTIRRVVLSRRRADIGRPVRSSLSLAGS